jgi:multidrug resistance efflux pump
MRPGTQLEAPTHLTGRSNLGLPPEWLRDEELSQGNEIVTSAVRGGRAVQAATPTSYSHHSFSQQPLSAYPPPRVVADAGQPARAPRVHTERSDSVKQVRTESSSDKLAAPPAPAADPRRTVSRGEAYGQPDDRRSPESISEAESDRRRAARRAERKARKAEKSVVKENSVARPSTKSVAAPQPEARASHVEMAMPPGINAIDPMAVPVPPEIGASIYSWVRRLALQADLAGADRVLRDALLDLSSSLSCSIVYPGEDGLWSLGSDDEIPRDAQPLIAVATARRAVVSSHSAIIPILTASETVGVITMTRNPRNPAYHPAEQIAMIALARESAAILHHLAIAHLQKQTEIEADKGGLYRGEALEAHRTRGSEGVPVHLTPSWVRRTYPFLAIAIVVAIVASIFITVPTYSTGTGVVMFDGAHTSAPAAGLIDKVYVQPGQKVEKGQILLRLNSDNERAELALAKQEEKIATTQYLLDHNDENAKRTLATAAARVERAKAQLDMRIVRASKDGTVTDTRLATGKMLQPGERILTIVEPGIEPEIVCFLEGKDRPRLKKGMKLQVALAGYTKTPETVEITYVGTEVIGGSEAARYIGAELADTLKQLQGGSFVIVKARLPRTFKTDRKEFRYHHGMTAKTEVKIQDKPFLVTLLPVLEKYLPNAD